MYRWNAEEYSRNSGNQERWAQGLLSQIPLSGDESILDIGCGDGKVTCVIAQRVPRGSALGIDNSREMIRVARAAFGSEFKNLRFMRKNACCLGIRNRFDVIYSNACFHWIHDQDALLESLFLALKPGGRLFAQMGGKGNFAAMSRAGEKVIRRKEWRKFFKGFGFPYYFFTRAEYARLLRKHGFKVESLRAFANYMEFSGEDEFKDSLRAIWIPYLHRVPEKLREVLLDQVVRRYLRDDPAGPKGKIKMKMRRLEFKALKPSTGKSMI